MTTNQIAYWDMQTRARQQAEQERANRASEDIKSREAGVKEREARIKEFMVPYEAANLTRQVSERQATQFEKVTKGLKNIFSTPAALFGMVGKD